MTRTCPVRSKARRPPAPQSYRAPGSAAGVHTSAITCAVSAPVSGGISTAIAGGRFQFDCRGFRECSRAGCRRTCFRRDCRGLSATAYCYRDFRRSQSDDHREGWPSVPAELPRHPFGRAGFRGWGQFRDWARRHGPGRYCALDFPHAHPALLIPNHAVPTPAPRSSGMQKSKMQKPKWTSIQRRAYG